MILITFSCKRNILLLSDDSLERKGTLLQNIFCLNRMKSALISNLNDCQFVDQRIFLVCIEVCMFNLCCMYVSLAFFLSGATEKKQALIAL
jgi:hypothetical protein